MLQPAFDTLNSSPNLFFLTKKVQSKVSRLKGCSGHRAASNQRSAPTEKYSHSESAKGEETRFRGHGQGYRNYLKQVGSSGTTVASLLDKELADIINTAKGVASKASKDKADKLKKAIVSVTIPFLSSQFMWYWILLLRAPTSHQRM